MRPRVRTEAAILSAVRRSLIADHGATLVEKTHGNAFQAGWPDLFVALPWHGPHARQERAQSRAVWIEVKRPTGRLTRAQRVRFAAWEDAGVGVWVVTCVHDLLVVVRGDPPNWRAWDRIVVKSTVGIPNGVLSS